MDRIDHVSDTAFLIAACRAAESARPDALFHDRLAARLASSKGSVLLDAFPTRAMTMWVAAVRTVVIDAFVEQAVAQSTDAVLNLGAGLDTRPYRLGLPPGLLWVEVDAPSVVRVKTEQLGSEPPRCRLERVELDLTDRAARCALLETLGRRAKRILVLTEGVVPYLPEAEVATLASDLLETPGVDAWIVDYLSPESHAYRERSGLDRHMARAPFAFRPADWFGFFASAEWTPRAVRYLTEEGRRLGRPAPLPWLARMWAAMPDSLAPGALKTALNHMSGYALLEPTQR